MAKTPKYVNYVSPKGNARYPKLSEPDTKGEYADNKYKTEIVLSEEDTAEFKKQLYAAAKVLLPDAKNPNIPMKTNKKDGTVSFIFKSKHRPMVEDAARNPIPKSVEVGGGSLIKCAGTLAAYEKGALKGITAYLDAVRVFDLKKARDAGAAFGDAEDGFNIKESDVQPEDRFADEGETAGSEEYAL